MVVIDVENASSRDFENVDIKAYTDPGTHLLNERTSIVGTPYIVKWSGDFAAQMAVPAGLRPTPPQLQDYWHSRDYRVAVLNRGQSLEFTYLCTRPYDDGQPTVLVDTQLKGAKLKRELRGNLLFGVPINATLGRGLAVAAVIVLTSGVFMRNPWAVGIVCVTAGMSGQMLGWIVYKAERWLRGLISG